MCANFYCVVPLNYTPKISVCSAGRSGQRSTTELAAPQKPVRDGGNQTSSRTAGRFENLSVFNILPSAGFLPRFYSGLRSSEPALAKARVARAPRAARTTRGNLVPAKAGIPFPRPPSRPIPMSNKIRVSYFICARWRDRTSGLHPAPFMCTLQGSNLRPSQCQCDALPLS